MHLFYIETSYSVNVLLTFFFYLKMIVRIIVEFCRSLLDQTRIIAVVSGLVLKDWILNPSLHNIWKNIQQTIMNDGSRPTTNKRTTTHTVSSIYTGDAGFTASTLMLCYPILKPAGRSHQIKSSAPRYCPSLSCYRISPLYVFFPPSSVLLISARTATLAISVSSIGLYSFPYFSEVFRHWLLLLPLTQPSRKHQTYGTAPNVT